jgi:hypothetical protein
MPVERRLEWKAIEEVLPSCRADHNVEFAWRLLDRRSQLAEELMEPRDGGRQRIDAILGIAAERPVPGGRGPEEVRNRSQNSHRRR